MLCCVISNYVGNNLTNQYIKKERIKAANNINTSANKYKQNVSDRFY